MPRAFKLWLALLLVAITMSGCSLYRCDLRQGNHITQAELDQLTPGLTKHEVQDIMGTPAMTPFYHLEEWNYSYAYVDGRHRDEPLKFKTISLYFKQDKLESYSSSFWCANNLPRHK